MNAQRIIVHSLIKKENQQTASLDMSNSLLDVDSKSIDLIGRLDESYKNTQLTYAVFSNNSAEVFPSEFQNFYTKSNDNSFIDFSQKAVTNLKQRVENISRAKGGYLVFAEYEVYNRRIVAVYLIRDTIGMLFRKDKSKSAYVINPAEHLDLNKLAMACKVDLSSYNSKDGKYLSFMKGARQEEISNYFINWISAQDLENNRTLTNRLYDLIKEVEELPKDEKAVGMTRDVFLEKIYDFVNSTHSKTVNINLLSEHFYGDRTYLRNLAEQKGIKIDTQFEADSKLMKKFVRIDLISDGIQLRFSWGDLNEKIWPDEDRVIIKSAKFAAQFQRETNLSQHETD